MTETYDRALDAAARHIFTAALNENRCGELLAALYDGAAATVDAQTGALDIVPSVVIEQLGGSDD